MQLDTFLAKLRQNPEQIEFTDTMAVIEATYQFSPTAFNNGELANLADQNNGSCKIFAFGKLHTLSEQQTLACFGAYYRIDVLQNPASNVHLIIRNFIKTGWAGINFDKQALLLKTN